MILLPCAPLHFEKIRSRRGGARAPPRAIYQRLFWRKPPPFVRDPPAPERAAFGRASLTLSTRPSSSRPLRAAIARSPSPSLLISTNPKPLARPVSRSVTRFTRSTVPCASNMPRMSASVEPKLRFPTNIFFKLFFFLRSTEQQMKAQDRAGYRTMQESRSASCQSTPI